ncbi:MAG: hypothetical protein ACOYJ8_03200 [Patescibacteria group bacterium]|jgi:hypothetical protein
MTKPKRKPQPNTKNLVQLAKEEIEAVAQESVDQLTPTEKTQSVTNQPPQPDYQNGALSSSEEGVAADNNKEKELREVRGRLLDLKKESDLSRKRLLQERKEKAEKRDPVVEGIETEENKNKEPKDDNLPLSPPKTTSRPKRGLPLGIGQPEKRKRR